MLMKKMNDFDTGFTGMFWMSLMTVVNFMFQLIITFFLARQLSPTDYGQVAALTIFTGIAELFWMLGVGPAIIQKKEINNDITTGNTLNILFGLLIFLIINIFASFWVNVFSISDVLMLRFYSLVFIVNSISSMSQSLSQKKCEFKRISFIRSISIIIYGASAIAFAYLKLGPWSLLYANVLQAVFITVVFMILEPIPLRFKIKRKSASALLYFGSGLTIGRIFNYIATRGDSFVVNKLMGKSQLGSLTRAQQLLMYPVSLVGESIDQVLFPLLSRGKGDEKKLKRVFLNGTGVIALISVPVTLIAYFRAGEIIHFFLGSNWENTIGPFKMLILGLFFRTGYKLSDALIRAMGKVYRGAVIQMVYSLFVVSGAYVGHFHGLEGVATGVTIAFMVNYILLTAMSMYLVHIKIKDIIITFFPAVLYGIITSSVILAINSFIIREMNDLMACIVTTLIVFAIYMVLYLTVGRYTMINDQRSFVNMLISRFNIFKKLELWKMLAHK